MAEATGDARTPVQGVQRMTPSEAFVETLVANGVTDMFGIMGSAFMDAMDIFAPAGIRLVPVVHEQGAGHMADGYARVSNRHGVVIGPNAVVDGPLVFEREVKLYVHGSARTGKITGASAIRFDTPTPPKD